MRYQRPRSRALLTEWLTDLAAHEPELNSAAATLRDSVILGYDSGNPEDARLRRAAQALANEFIDVSAAVIDAYLAMEATLRTEADHARVHAAVRLCDNVGNQLYFSSGAFRAGENEQPTGLVSMESRLTFLNEMEGTLRRIGDVGTPHTIYYLIDMLRHLRPVDPERVFDLVAHSLLNAGRKHGYQFEGMGNDRFVEVVGFSSPIIARFSTIRHVAPTWSLASTRLSKRAGRKRGGCSTDCPSCCRLKRTKANAQI